MAVLISLGASAAAAEVLFPEPLHLTRRIEDPISGSAVTIEEYCFGNRIVTVRGQKVAIADYERQQITEIDRAAATYSVTSFADLARTREATRSRRGDASPDRPAFDVSVDRSVTLSRQALEVLVGAAYPNQRTWQYDVIARAAATPRQRMQSTSAEQVESYALPVDQSLSWEDDGRRMTMRNVIIAVDRKPPPPELLVIPPGARLVEPANLATDRLLRELESRPKD